MSATPARNPIADNWPAMRQAALIQLAAEIPTPILADVLGIAANTAARWAALASRDWSQYTAQRANPTPL